MARTINIEHKNGERYAVEPKDYHKIYEPLGFKATTYQDNGEEYVAPEKADKSAETKRTEKAGE